MNRVQYIEVFQQMVSFAVDYQYRYHSSHEYEPAFFAVLMYASNSEPELQREAELEFVRMLNLKGSNIHELLCYCMPELQFSLVKKEVVKLLEVETDLRTKRVLSNVLESYDYNEEDTDYYYSYYRDKHAREKKNG